MCEYSLQMILNALKQYIVCVESTIENIIGQQNKSCSKPKRKERKRK